MRDWSPRRWLAALAAAALSALVLGLPTAVIPNPVFGRGIAPTAWSAPVLVVTAVLSGLVLATYVREPVLVPSPSASTWPETREGEGPDAAVMADDEGTRRLGAGGLLSFVAIGCPTCNKLVLLALGSSGAVRWFAPIQPVLAIGAIVLLAWTLRRRLAEAASCRLT